MPSTKLKRQVSFLVFMILFTFAFVNVITYAYTSSLWRAPTGGTIVIEGVEVYWDEAGTNPATSIDWSYLIPGEQKIIGLYVKNVGNFPSTITLWTANYVPVNASQFLSLSWNYDGSIIEPNQFKAVDITLHVNPEIQGITDFSFDIGITIAADLP